MNKHLTFLLLGSLAFHPTISVLAQDIESMTVKGTRIQSTLLTDAVPSISLNRDDIEALSANSIADVLRGQAGVDISQQGGAGGLTFLSIRGGDPNFVIILIDGVKVNDPTNSRGGAFDLASIDPALVENIEVYYGSFSSVHGTDALAGVVSIQTQSYQQGKIGRASLTLSGEQSVGATANLALPIGNVAEMSISASIQEGDDSTFSDAFSRKQLIASAQSYSDSATQWQVGGFYSRGEGKSFPEDSGGERLAVIRSPEAREFTQTNLKADTQHKVDSHLSFNLSSAWSQREEDISNPGIAVGVLDGVPAIESVSEYERFDLTAAANYNFSEKIDLVLGIAWSDENGGMKSVIDFGAPVQADYTLERQTKAVFAEAAINPSQQLSILLGARRDKTDKLLANTHRVIVSYQLTPNLSFSGHVSQGFKLPSFFALAHPFVGNSELKPEESENLEFSIRGQFPDEKGELRFSAYQNTYSNLVDFDPIAFTNVNRAKVRAEGVEAQLKLFISKQVTLNAQVTHTKLDTFDPEVTLRRRPEWKGSVILSYRPIEKLNLTSRWVINDGYYDSAIPTGLVELEAFNQWDLSARWSLNEKTSVRLNMQNVLSSDHEEGVGFSNPGRQISANISRLF